MAAKKALEKISKLPGASKTVRNSPLTPGNQVRREMNDYGKAHAAALKAYDVARTTAPFQPGKGTLRIWARGEGYDNIQQRTPSLPSVKPKKK